MNKQHTRKVLFASIPLIQQQSSNASFSQTKLSMLEHGSTPFYTEVRLKSGEELELQQYIANLRKQIKNAVWKQELVLQYNFLPLQQIKDKILLQKQAHQHKMNLFKSQYQKILENQQFTSELSNLRNFNLKLKDKMKNYQLQISQQNVKIALLKADAQKRKQRLKQLIKSNMQLSKSYAQKLGANNKQDIIRLVRAKSQRVLQKRLSFNGSVTQRKGSLLKRSQSAKLKIKNIIKKSLFEDCLQKLIDQIKNMNSSSDIQSGIYLEIMNKKSNQFSHAGRTSHRSTISNTLHQRYAPLIHKKGNKHYQQNDFEMEFQDFNKLNWKQMLGVVMVKDKGCHKLKRIFKNFQFDRVIE